MAKVQREQASVKPDRWPEDPPDRLGPEERAKRMDAFLTASFRLLNSWREREDWTDAERLALALVTDISRNFHNPPGAAWAKSIRQVSKLLQSEPTLERRRYWALDAIAEAQRSPDLSMDRLLLRLRFADEAFADLKQEAIRPRLDASSPERALAEILTYDCDALGFETPAPEPPEDSVERIRTQLVKAVDRVRSPRRGSGQ